ncbi:MAG: zf-TFIIB domain-containing protein [Candidatus Gastranaerophilales bacterium]|nr:zf-TFIIB domain-containing protein [Candidatus Gastranaerophilales bacterium]
MYDNEKIIACPACKKIMKKVYVASAGMSVDICVDGCGGIYFDRNEFKRVDEQHEDITPILNEIENKTFNEVNNDFKRECPDCGAVMTRNYTSANLSIQIDVCYRCGGTFLDNQELQKIRAEFPTEEARNADFAKRLYHIFGQEYEARMKDNAQWIKESEKKRRKIIKDSIMRGVETFVNATTFGAYDKMKELLKSK